MNIIKSSIYYDKSTGVISLPNISKLQCVKCESNDYLCLLCNKCKLHETCWQGRHRFMVNENGQRAVPYEYCSVCHKTKCDYTNSDTHKFCSICYVCNKCHGANKCEFIRRFCATCNSNTIHCVGCDVCLKHYCHDCKNGRNVMYGHHIILEPDHFEDYSTVFYKDRCSTCIRFVDPVNVNDMPEMPMIEHLKSTLWICRICIGVECGICFNQTEEVCSLCAADHMRYFNVEDFSYCCFGTIDPTNGKISYKRGRVCTMCGIVEIGKFNEEIWLPHYCKACLGDAADSYKFDVSRIPK